MDLLSIAEANRPSVSLNQRITRLTRQNASRSPNLTTLLGRGSSEPSTTSKDQIESDLGGLRKSVNEHGVKIEALTQAKQRNAGKENVKSKTPEIRHRVNSLEVQPSRARARASKPRLHLPTSRQSRKLGLILSLRRK
jgi:hypothetical protein